MHQRCHKLPHQYTPQLFPIKPATAGGSVSQHAPSTLSYLCSAYRMPTATSTPNGGICMPTPMSACYRHYGRCVQMCVATHVKVSENAVCKSNNTRRTAESESSLLRNTASPIQYFRMHATSRAASGSFFTQSACSQPDDRALHHRLNCTCSFARSLCASQLQRDCSLP